MKTRPDYSARGLRQRYFYFKDQDFLERDIDALRQAGPPD
jgi:hypothetical protein